MVFFFFFYVVFFFGLDFNDFDPVDSAPVLSSMVALEQSIITSSGMECVAPLLLGWGAGQAQDGMILPFSLRLRTSLLHWVKPSWISNRLRVARWQIQMSSPRKPTGLPMSLSDLLPSSFSVVKKGGRGRGFHDRRRKTDKAVCHCRGCRVWCQGWRWTRIFQVIWQLVSSEVWMHWRCRIATRWCLFLLG